MKKAFTLIELLIVIAIIAILAAIIFPVFSQSKLQAKKSVSLSNLKQLVLADIFYRDSNDGAFTPLSVYKGHTLVIEPVLRKPYGYTLPINSGLYGAVGLQESMFSDLCVVPLYCPATSLEVDLFHALHIVFPYSGYTVVGYADGHSKSAKPNHWWRHMPSLDFPDPDFRWNDNNGR